MSQAGLEMQAISDALKAAKPYKLECEVIWSALKAIQKNPKTTIEEAMVCGVYAWDL